METCRFDQKTLEKAGSEEEVKENYWKTVEKSEKKRREEGKG